MSAARVLGGLVALAATGGGVSYGILHLLGGRRRAERLRAQYGPEYERAVHQFGTPRAAEAELLRRKREVEQLPIRRLDANQHDHFAGRWQSVQAQFDQDAAAATREADRLVEEIMRTSGYPVGSFEQITAALSVRHPRVVDNYRAVRNIALRHGRGQATPEDLRQAMVYHRDLVKELLANREPVTPPPDERFAPPERAASDERFAPPERAAVARTEEADLEDAGEPVSDRIVDEFAPAAAKPGVADLPDPRGHVPTPVDTSAIADPRKVPWTVLLEQRARAVGRSVERFAPPPRPSPHTPASGFALHATSTPSEPAPGQPTPPGPAQYAVGRSTVSRPHESAEAKALVAELAHVLQGRYVLGEILGSGRAGVTVSGRNVSLRRDVALKVAWNDLAARTQLIRESVLTAKVVHRSVLAVRTLDAEPLIAAEMPLAVGGTLGEALDAREPLPFAQVLDVMRAAAGALDEAHAIGIIHGALRPEKILVDDKGSYLLSDFSLRLPPQAEWDAPRPSAVGEAAYSSFEQRHDLPTVDGRADQFSLAIIAYELLRGERIWRVNREGVLEIDAPEVMVHRPIAPDAPLSASMAIKRAISRDPAHRYENVGLFVAAFAGQAAESLPTEQMHRADLPVVERGRSPLWWLIPAFALLAAAVALKPSVRETLARWWNASWAGEGSGVSIEMPTLPPPPMPVAEPPRRRAETNREPSGEPTNTRVGEPQKTAPPVRTGPAIDPFPRVSPPPATSAPAPARSSGGSGGVPAGDAAARRAAAAGRAVIGAPGSTGGSRARSTLGTIAVTLAGNARATVIIDGRERGRTPLFWQAPPGRHRVSLRGVSGYSPASITISVTAGDTARATFSAARPR